MSAVYGASTVKRRRSTKADLADLDDAIVGVVEDDFPVSLRGVYYRVVSRGAVEKTENGYRRVGRRLLELRRSGRIPYDRITDGTRWVIKPRTYNDHEDALNETAALYRRALWRSQPAAVHVFVEKDAISGVVSAITREWDVPLGVLRGYCSETFAYDMAEAIRSTHKTTYVYQLGDHDPSGVGAWDDFTRKVSAFLGGVTEHDEIGNVHTVVHFERLAVTPDQIRSWELPTRPTKAKDTRSKTFTGESVEVDAIPAPTLRSLVEDAIVQHIDPAALERTRVYERSERELLTQLAATDWVMS